MAIFLLLKVLLSQFVDPINLLFYLLLVILRGFNNYNFFFLVLVDQGVGHHLRGGTLWIKSLVDGRSEWFISKIWRLRTRKQIFLLGGFFLSWTAWRTKLFLVSAGSILFLQNITECALILLLLVVHHFYHGWEWCLFNVLTIDTRNCFLKLLIHIILELIVRHLGLVDFALSIFIKIILLLRELLLTLTSKNWGSLFLGTL